MRIADYLTGYANIVKMHGIPEHCREGVVRYIVLGDEIGDFLSAVFADKFAEAACRADDINGRAMRAYGTLLYALPMACWGSPERVQQWQARGGLIGRGDPLPSDLTVSIM